MLALPFHIHPSQCKFLDHDHQEPILEDNDTLDLSKLWHKNGSNSFSGKTAFVYIGGLHLNYQDNPLYGRKIWINEGRLGRPIRKSMEVLVKGVLKYCTMLKILLIHKIKLPLLQVLL